MPCSVVEMTNLLFRPDEILAPPFTMSLGYNGLYRIEILPMLIPKSKKVTLNVMNLGFLFMSIVVQIWKVNSKMQGFLSFTFNALHMHVLEESLKTYRLC